MLARRRQTLATVPEKKEIPSSASGPSLRPELKPPPAGPHCLSESPSEFCGPAGACEGKSEGFDRRWNGQRSDNSRQGVK